MAFKWPDRIEWEGGGGEGGQREKVTADKRKRWRENRESSSLYAPLLVNAADWREHLSKKHPPSFGRKSGNNHGCSNEEGIPFKAGDITRGIHMALTERLQVAIAVVK